MATHTKTTNSQIILKELGTCSLAHAELYVTHTWPSSEHPASSSPPKQSVARQQEAEVDTQRMCRSRSGWGGGCGGGVSKWWGGMFFFSLSLSDCRGNLNAALPPHLPRPNRSPPTFGDLHPAPKDQASDPELLYGLTRRCYLTPQDSDSVPDRRPSARILCPLPTAQTVILLSKPFRRVKPDRWRLQPLTRETVSAVRLCHPASGWVMEANTLQSLLINVGGNLKQP